MAADRILLLEPQCFGYNQQTAESNSFQQTGLSNIALKSKKGI